jgi:23S rRNA (pseudouridine1915-N3)-methyltransferase
MKARLVAVGERAPAWVAQGFAEYQKRLSHWLPLELVEIEPGLRGKGRDAARATRCSGTGDTVRRSATAARCRRSDGYRST